MQQPHSTLPEISEPLFIYKDGQLIQFFQNQGYFRQDYQWYLHNTGQNSILTYGGAYNGQDAGGTYDINIYPEYLNERGVTVGLVDSGCDVTHPDLKDVVIKGRQFNRRNEFDPLDYSDWDQFSHGTTQAGIVAALRNGIGIQGVAQCKLLMARTRLAVTQDGIPEIADAIRWLVMNGAKIIVLPWGTMYDDVNLKEQCAFAAKHEVLIVASTRNQQPYYYDVTKDYPSAWQLPNVLPVCGIDRTRTLYWSAIGKDCLAAPSRIIIGTRKGGDYCYVSGTSAAAAIVGGVASILKYRFPAARPDELKSALLSCSKIVSNGYNIAVLDFKQALAKLTPFKAPAVLLPVP